MSELPPRIPASWTPPADQRPASTASFTHADALAWLGVSRKAYERAVAAGDRMGVGPLDCAILDARAANSSVPRHARPGIEAGVTTATEVLARYGIDPQRPELAVTEWLADRSRYWS